MNLDDRIARDAERWHADDHAPDFDTALHSATRTRRNLLAPILVAAAIVLIGLVIAALLALPRHAAPSGEKTDGLIYRRNEPSASLVFSSPAPNVPPPMTRADGIRVRYESVPNVPAVAALVDPAKPRTLTLFVADQGGGQCSPSDVTVTAVRQSEDSVRVHLAGTATTEINAQGQVILSGCMAVSFDPIHVTLDAPLGDRSVSSGAVEHPLPVLYKGELSQPTYLPTGYEQRLDIRGSDLTSSLTFVRTYQRGPRGGLVLIYIRAASSSLGVKPSGDGSIAVNGHRANFDTDGGRCLEWYLRAGVYEAVCIRAICPTTRSSRSRAA